MGKYLSLLLYTATFSGREDWTSWSLGVFEQKVPLAAEGGSRVAEQGV